MRAKGQILIIVMVLMAVIAILMVSITNNVIRDTQDSGDKSRSDTIYSLAENLSIQFGRSFGNPAKISVFDESQSTEDLIKGFLTENGYVLREVDGRECEYNVPRDGNRYRCTVCNIERIPPELDSEALTLESTIEGNLSVCDTPFIENAEVFKDEIIVFDLEGVPNNVSRSGAYTISVENLSVDPDTAKLALEVAVDFNFVDNANNEYIATAKTLVNYANSNLFPAGGANNAFTDADNTRYIVISGPTAQGNKLNYSFNINAGATNFLSRVENTSDTGYISHLYPEGNTIQVQRINQIRIKPYMTPNNNETRVRIGISSSNPNINITQGRRIEAKLYEKSLSNNQIIGSEVIVVSTVPAVKYPTLFDYVVKTNIIE